MARKKMATSKAEIARNVRALDDEEDIDSTDVMETNCGRKMPWFGWLGLGIMILSEIALWGRFHPVAVGFTPSMWTGYILLVDGWIWARCGKSYFRDGKLYWPMLTLFSILIWVLFETINFSVEGWRYPIKVADPWLRDLLYMWAFATIIPALLRTRSLFATFDFFERSHPWNIKFTPFALSVSFVAGIALTFLPLMLRHYYANLLIWSIWIGFIFLIEPINYRIGAPSVFRDLESPKFGGNGKVRFLWQALLAGLLCGFLWETWNIQTFHFKGLYWEYYINDIYWKAGFGLHWGKMPILGFLGYPPFIWECYALWEFIKWVMDGNTLWKSAKA